MPNALQVVSSISHTDTDMHNPFVSIQFTPFLLPSDVVLFIPPKAKNTLSSSHPIMVSQVTLSTTLVVSNPIEKESELLPDPSSQLDP